MSCHCLSRALDLVRYANGDGHSLCFRRISPFGRAQIRSGDTALFDCAGCYIDRFPLSARPNKNPSVRFVYSELPDASVSSMQARSTAFRSPAKLKADLAVKSVGRAYSNNWPSCDFSPQYEHCGQLTVLNRAYFVLKRDCQQSLCQW